MPIIYHVSSTINPDATESGNSSLLTALLILISRLQKSADQDYFGLNEVTVFRFSSFVTISSARGVRTFLLW